MPTIPADVGHLQKLRRKARLDRCVLQIGCRQKVVVIVRHAGEMYARQPTVLPTLRPGLDQRLVDGVILIRPRKAFLQPMPLNDCGLEQRRRRVGVVFQELGRVGAVKTQIEATVKRGLSSKPASGGEPAELRADAELVEPLPLDNMRNGRIDHPSELGAGRVQRLDLGLGECVGGIFPPVDRCRNLAEIDAEGREFRVPAGPWR